MKSKYSYILPTLLCLQLCFSQSRDRGIWALRYAPEVWDNNNHRLPYYHYLFQLFSSRFKYRFYLNATECFCTTNLGESLRANPLHQTVMSIIHARFQTSHHKKIIFIWWLALDFMAIYLLFSFPDWDISYIYNIDICFSASYLWHSFSHLCKCSLDLSLLFAWRSLCIPHSYKSETMDIQFSQILVDTLNDSRKFLIGI